MQWAYSTTNGCTFDSRHDTARSIVHRVGQLQLPWAKRRVSKRKSCTVLDSVRQNKMILLLLFALDCALYSAIPRQVHVKDYALHAVMQQCIKFIAAREGSPHNVLHSSSYFYQKLLKYMYAMKDRHFHLYCRASMSLDINALQCKWKWQSVVNRFCACV